MILSADTILGLCTNTSFPMVHPFSVRTLDEVSGTTYGLSACGYDIRLDQDVYMWAGIMTLASSIEKFTMPDNVMGVVHDKSTWARRGVAVQNTVIEPGWRGYLTLELSLHDDDTIFIRKGSPIAQVIFHKLDKPTSQPYNGKYQDQESGPQEAR